MNAALRVGAAVVAGCALAGLLAADRHAERAAGPRLAGQVPRLTLTVTSSHPDQVTGGDARVVVTVPRGVRADQVRLTRDDGADLTSLLWATHRAERPAVVSGLRPGRTTLTATAAGRRATLTLHDHGDGPIFSGPRQYPFVCRPARAGPGQPIIDNHARQGLRVFAERNGTRTLKVAGWSRDCAARTKVDYLYRSSDGTFHPLPDPRRRPADMVETTTLDGHTVPYLVRRERGVINRFVYTIAMLAPLGGAEHRPGLIDAAIPQFAFPDAITRITGIGDCEPLERYFDTSRDPLWRTWANRALVEGLPAGGTARAPRGASVCANGWRGLTQRLFNPRYPPWQPGWAFMDPPGVMNTVRGGYWEGLRPGQGRTWDNVGVQYGLRAVRDGRLSPARFLDLNARVGGWRPPADMRAEGCPYVPPGCAHDPDPWSARNLTGAGSGSGSSGGGAAPPGSGNGG